MVTRNSNAIPPVRLVVPNRVGTREQANVNPAPTYQKPTPPPPAPTKK
nr:hypothetical protein [uncultured Undibacterium sp.]